eukprot:CAMPEP_0178910146 /NCGR_PEP_ID=MMETSP0786-20121207/8931_1 /TAXON_ID=186022 /ORGANISM="Thalassionema frauenfeldii, Strain CCMP 1798" /LENGTH=856 /DNA_ID=CAMNT_0020582357 /DNA_START=197 /DNA_END=2767 /DNA_ORIENTATION=-
MVTTIVTETKKKSAFATPDRDLTKAALGVKKEPIAKEVTPSPELTPKQVRFDNQEDGSSISAATTARQRGTVSRRGGRHGSPSRLKSEGPASGAIYRSPKKETESADGVPSLCSSNSGNLTAVKTVKEGDGVDPAQKPSSISCDAAETTSPLTSHEETAAAVSNKKKNPEARNVTFSPRPKEGIPERTKKTPTRSPSGGHFHNLPSLQDAGLTSPCGIFLSPCPPSPSAYATIAAEPKFQEEKSSKALERERAVATPTDFAVDFGKGHKHSESFDASNVLAWLQSPTANGLFSPGGGFGSVSNTPRGAPRTPRTPRTPTMSTTSFFFSDVASLPRNGDFASPKEPKSQRGGMTSISISPLASSKRKASRNNTPINYKEVFASPGGQSSSHSIKPRSMPLLGESPSGKSKEFDVHVAERDLMEDEDLSVLLQLASSNTPRSCKDGSDVFRSPRGRKSGNFGDRNQAPQIPIIGGQGDGTATKLPRKSMSQGGPNADDFAPPPHLGIRSTSSGASREIFSRDDVDKGGVNKSMNKDSSKSNDAMSDVAQGSKKKHKKSKNRKSGQHNGYGAHPYTQQHRSDGSAYGYPMPGGMPAMPPGGSMRVVVGAPPPMGSRAGSKKSSDGYGPHSMYPPPPPYHHPHMGVPPPYGYPHPPPPRPMPPMYPSSHSSKGSSKGSSKKTKVSKNQKASCNKRPAPIVSGTGVKGSPSPSKKPRKQQPKAASKKKKTTATTVATPPGEGVDRQKTAAAIAAVNAASGGKNDRAAALAAAILRGVTMRPSGKWQAQLYYAGKSRYIGVFDTREKAALAYEIAREKLKSDNKSPADQSAQSLKATENAVNAARKAAFEGVNEKDPRVTGK